MMYSKGMSRSTRIETLLRANIPVKLIEIHDESDAHRGHYERAQDRETHLRLVIVSVAFNGMTRLERHRYVQSLLKAEFKKGLHALSLDLSGTH